MNIAPINKKEYSDYKYKEYPAATKLLSWLPTLFIAAAIFWFSAQPAAESTEMSAGTRTATKCTEKMESFCAMPFLVRMEL